MRIRLTLVLECPDDTGVAQFSLAKMAASSALEQFDFAVKDVKLAMIDPEVPDVSNRPRVFAACRHCGHPYTDHVEGRPRASKAIVPCGGRPPAGLFTCQCGGYEESDPVAPLRDSDGTKAHRPISKERP
jgi:hypothetical protein